MRSIGKKAEPLLRFCDSLSHASLRFAGYLLALAPLAVIVTISATVASQGPSLLRLDSSLLLALVLFTAMAVRPLLDREMSRAEAASALALAATSALAPNMSAVKPTKLHNAAVVPVPLTWEMPAPVATGPKTTYAYDDGQAVS